MDGIRIDTTIDERIAHVLPALRPFLGRRVEFVALKEDRTTEQKRTLTVDELLASRIKLPLGIGPLTLADMEQAIAEGALGN